MKRGHSLLPVFDTGGKVVRHARVDNEDFEWAKHFRWVLTPQGYVRARTVYLHRLVMRESDSKIWIDHIDGEPLNNARSNLRRSNPQLNAANRSAQANCESGVKNVHFCKQTRRWKVVVQRNHVSYYGGFHSSLLMAEAAARRLRKRVFPELEGKGVSDLRKGV